MGLHRHARALGNSGAPVFRPALSLTASDTPASAKKRAATEDLEGHLHKRLRGDGSPIDTPSADSGSNSSDGKEEKKEDSSSA